MAYSGDEGNFGKSFVSFITGGLVGAGIALLYAPQSGERTREEIKEKAERTIIKVQRIEEEIKDSINQLLGDIRSKVNLLIEEGKDVAEDKKQELLAAIETGKKVLDEQKSRLQKKDKRDKSKMTTS
jgi:gas vesicle protein